MKEIAEIYIEWQSVIAELEDPKAKSKVEAVFSMLREIMEEYGCNLGRSEIGTKRNTKISKLKAKIYVDSADLHETVAKAIMSG